MHSMCIQNVSKTTHSPDKVLNLPHPCQVHRGPTNQCCTVKRIISPPVSTLKVSTTCTVKCSNNKDYEATVHGKSVKEAEKRLTAVDENSLNTANTKPKKRASTIPMPSEEKPLLPSQSSHLHVHQPVSSYLRLDPHPHVTNPQQLRSEHSTNLHMINLQ